MAAPSTILVLDDHALHRAIAQATLEDVLLDVRMPDVDGPMTCERIWIDDAAPGAAFCLWSDHAD